MTNVLELVPALDTKADRRDAAGMSEAESHATAPPSSGGAAPAQGSPGTVSAESAPAAPVNKVHEWTAAAALVVLLSLILIGFVYFLRGASI